MQWCYLQHASNYLILNLTLRDEQHNYYAQIVVLRSKRRGQSTPQRLVKGR